MTLDQAELYKIYWSRPDLQAVYNTDGTAKNPKDPRVAGIPTLNDWGVQFGLKDNPSLDSTYSSLSKYFTPDEIKGMDDSTRTALSAFVDVQTKNLEQGKVNADINAQNWNDAMATAAADPSIAQKYGDALKVATDQTNKALSDTVNAYQQNANATNRQNVIDTRNLNANEDAAGRAYSGFRTQAQNNLKSSQNDIITSSLRQLQQNINSNVSPYEQKYGEKGLSNLNLPNIKGNNGMPDTAYSPLGLAGSNDIAQKNDIRGLATEFYGATADPTTSSTTNGTANQ